MHASTASVPHIFTLTGNLLAERTLEFEQWEPGKTQRAKRESFQVGGKGINVSKMLTRLGVPNTALCFTGGAPGAECEAWLRSHAFHFRAFGSSTATRSGTVIRDANKSGRETTFLGPDVAPDPPAISECASFLNGQPPGQVLVISGSIPGWSTSTFDGFRAAIKRWTEKGILIADSYGPPLVDLVRLAPTLLKINADELRSLGISTFEMLPREIRHVVVTDGPRTVRFRDHDGTRGELTPPPIHEISPTGSGDVLLACLIDAMFVRKTPLPSAVAFAIPYATANAAHAGIAEFPMGGAAS